MDAGSSSRSSRAKDSSQMGHQWEQRVNVLRGTRL
jgi:hypothetical protein